MAELDLNRATTTDLENSVPDFIIDAKALDAENDNKEITYHYFSEAPQNYGIYFEVPEVYSCANALATYVAGKGVKIEGGDTDTIIMLEHITGQGVDSSQSIFWNHQVVKKVVGDAFAQAIWEDDDPQKKLLNLIPKSPERVRVAHKGGRILHYDVYDGTDWKKVETTHMLHSCNNRIGDQIHGTSQNDAVKWILYALSEALISNKMIERRGRCLGVIEFDTDDETKRNKALEEVGDAMITGEMVGYGKDTMKLLDFPIKSIGERMEWVRHLESKFYQCYGVPKVIATSEGFTEAGSLSGFLTFEPTYTREQAELEADLWNQLGIKIKFIRPPQLGGVVEDNQTKNNAGAVQPTDVTPALPAA